MSVNKLTKQDQEFLYHKYTHELGLSHDKAKAKIEMFKLNINNIMEDAKDKGASEQTLNELFLTQLELYST